MAKTLNTRILLKYDTLSNWSKTDVAGQGANFIPKKGEVCLVEVPSGASEKQVTPPAVLAKVGDGTSTFAQLPYMSALAADVYSWAKAANKPTYTYIEVGADEAGAAASALQDAKDYTDEALSGISGTDTQYRLQIDSSTDPVTMKLQSKEKQATTWSDIAGQSWNLRTLLHGEIADGNLGFVNGDEVYDALGLKQDTVAFDGGYNKTSNKAATVKTVTDAVSAEETRATGIEAGLRTDVNSKVASVTGENAINVTSGTTPKVTLVIDTTNPGNVTLTQGTNGLKAAVEIPDAPIAGVKSGEKVLSLDSDDKIQTTLSLGYDTANKKIQLKGISDQVVAELDATNFIKDGMVSTVTFNPSTKKLTITFNTDAGKEPIEIDMTSLVDTYTAGNGIDITSNTVSVKKDSASEAFLSVGTGGVKLSGVGDAISNAADTAQSNAQDYTDGKIEDEVTRADGAYLGKTAKAADADKLDGNDSTYFATASSVTAIENTMATYGDIVTHDADEFDAAGAADTAETNAKAYADTLNTAMDTRVDALEADIDDKPTVFEFTVEGSTSGVTNGAEIATVISNFKNSTADHKILLYVNRSTGARAVVTPGGNRMYSWIVTDTSYTGTLYYIQLNTASTDVSKYSNYQITTGQEDEIFAEDLASYGESAVTATTLDGILDNSTFVLDGGTSTTNV